MNFLEFKALFEKKQVIHHPSETTNFPLLSVCVQTYNQVSYIKDCLNSILAQETDFSYEILLGDDGSTDGTREVCLSYAEKYPDKIRLFLHHRENNIKIASKNTSIFNSLYNLYSAKGKFLAYCDGDDIWSDLKKIQKQVNYFQNHPETVFCYHEVVLIDEKKNILPKPQFLGMSERDFTSEELRNAIVQPPISTWCFRNVINEFPKEFFNVFNGDNFLISLLGFHGNGRFLRNIRPNLYRTHSESMWSSENKIFQLRAKFGTYKNLSEYYNRIKNYRLAYNFQTRANNYAKMVLAYYLRKRQPLKFLNFLVVNCEVLIRK